MATIPDSGQFGNASPSLGQAQRINISTSHIDALGKLAQAGADSVQKIQEAEDELAVNREILAAKKTLTQVDLSLQNDTQYDTHAGIFDAEVRVLGTEAQARLSDRQYKKFSAKFGGLTLDHGVKVQSRAQKGQLNVMRGELDLQMRGYADMIASAPNEQRREDLRNDGMAALRSGFDKGVIDGKELASEFIKFHDEVIVSDVRRAIRQDPDQATTDLLTGKYPLPPETLERWIDASIAKSDANARRINTEERQREARVAKQRKLVSDATAKEGDALFAAGELNTTWIEANYDKLDPADHRYFYKQLIEPTEKSKPLIYGPLRESAMTQDVSDQARDALRNGDITISDYNTLISRSEQHNSGSGMPTALERGERFIGKKLRVSDMNPDPGAPSRLAESLDTWYQWVQDHPNASLPDQRAAYTQIADEFSMLDTPKSTLSLRMPTYRVGGRNQMDLNATKLATRQAFERGDLNTEQLDAQIELLEDWRIALDREGRGNAAN